MKKMYIAPEVELLTMNVEMPMAMSIRTDAGVGYGGDGNDTDNPDVKDDQDWDIWNLDRAPSNSPIMGRINPPAQ